MRTMRLLQVRPFQVNRNLSMPQLLLVTCAISASSSKSPGVARLLPRLIETV